MYFSLQNYVLFYCKTQPVQWLEKIIDEYAVEPNPVESFILPGGSSLAAEMHICRTITRRAERRIVSFQKNGDHESLCFTIYESPVGLLFCLSAGNQSSRWC